MCLGVPMEVVALEGEMAEVAQAGVRRRISLAVCDEPPRIGDYVIVHAGFAIHRLDPEEAAQSLDLLGQLEAAGES